VDPPAGRYHTLNLPLHEGVDNEQYLSLLLPAQGLKESSSSVVPLVGWEKYPILASFFFRRVAFYSLVKNLSEVFIV